MSDIQYIQSLIDKGLSLREMERELGRPSYETIRKSIRELGLYEYWMGVKSERKNAELERRQAEQMELKEKESLMKKLALVLREKLEGLAGAEGWHYQKAVDYIMLKENRSVSDQSILKLFERYEKAKNNDIKLSLEKLAEGLGIKHTQVRNILYAVGLEPMHGRRIHRVISKEKKEILERVYYLDMPATDIAYFLDLPTQIVRNKFRRMGKRMSQNNMHVGNSRLTNMLASQVYEAQDLGFSLEETVELLDAKKEIVDYHVSHRETIEPKIIGALRILYPTNEITTPYITK